jgi:hypothetical protein
VGAAAPAAPDLLLSLLFRYLGAPLAVLSGNPGGCTINATGFMRRPTGTSLTAYRNPGLLVFDRIAPG